VAGISGLSLAGLERSDEAVDDLELRNPHVPRSLTKLGLHQEGGRSSMQHAGRGIGTVAAVEEIGSPLPGRRRSAREEPDQAVRITVSGQVIQVRDQITPCPER
jgi:hypothetical protein